jgi:hypothetical protein
VVVPSARQRASAESSGQVLEMMGEFGLGNQVPGSAASIVAVTSPTWAEPPTTSTTERAVGPLTQLRCQPLCRGRQQVLSLT